MPTSAIDAPQTPEEELIYIVSHDLRGPLLNLQGFLGRLEGACRRLRSEADGWDLPAEQRQGCLELLDQKVGPSLEAMGRNAARMERLIGRLLELSRAGREPLCPGLIDGAELVKALEAEFGPQAAQRQVALSLGPLPDFWADQCRVEEILRRLLSNALKFLAADRAGQVSLRGTAADFEVTFCVRDNGIGIEPRYQERIFRPFPRIREPDTGEAVGLAIVQKLVGQLGGRLGVQSAPGEGSSFFFSVPQKG